MIKSPNTLLSHLLLLSSLSLQEMVFVANNPAAAHVAIIFFCCFLTLVSAATLLPDYEVEALKQVGKTLGKTDWNFSADPCSRQWGWVTQYPAKGSENAVTCNCSFFNNTVCHVVSIILKSQNLQGVLPQELIQLPYLQEIDLTRNFLNGTIPPEWGSMQLVNISLLGNRLTGSIPKEFGNISTLANLTLEHNQLSGSIPPELGNLPRIEKIFLNSNNFTGDLPQTLGKLSTLKDFRIGDNHFKGKIPNFIQNWTKLEKLVIQGSGLAGPIPSGIAFLTKLTDLRISNLDGGESTFPSLSNVTKLKTLILRSCNLIGPLPEYLRTMTNLKTIDLSFNKLSGPIPTSFSSLTNAQYIYVTGNMLSGSTADWMLKGGNIDLSYNNLTTGSTTASSCQQGNINLFKSSSDSSNSGNVTCLRSKHCFQNSHSLYINCGGNEVTVDGARFENDIDSGGPSKFVESGSNWAFSSTGHFLDDDRPRDSFIWLNNEMKNPLYTTARLSPISLTYYAFCMLNGNYTVRLHFAEIMFTDDKTYSSLGRRIFDIYIQGYLVLKDFDIDNEAGGVRKEIVKIFTAIVSDSTLEIRFYYAGKGTTSIPVRGVYGPLISAISVDPDFTPPSQDGKKSMSIGTIVGIVVAVAFTIFFVLCILWWRGCVWCKDTMDPDLKGLDLHSGSFTLRQIKAATNNFDTKNKIGEGGFGPVYKGILSDGTIIAVKQLSSKSKQGNREFINEIGMISALQHPHLVKLYGCCIEGNQLLVIYEYMENNSLARALFGPEELQLELDWPTRHKICIGIARGLAYLHEESRLKIVHRDIKATNVLLDKNLTAKISDFGLAKLDDEENTHISTRIAGTYGYMAPEYAMRGYLTDKADVYSFGIVTLEIISGRANTSFRPKDNSFYLLDWALVLKEKGDLLELVDPRMGSSYDKTQVRMMINLALQCTDVSPGVRPTMSSVVSILEGRSIVRKSGASSSEGRSIVRKSDASSSVLEDAKKANEMSGQYGISIDAPWTASSTSTADLYPENFEADYWKDRG